MANQRLGNIIYIDATGSISTDRNTRVIGIILTTAGAGDEVILTEASGGAPKLALKHATDEDSNHIDLNNSPVIFGTGIYCSAIASGMKVMLIVSQSGGE